MTALGTTPATPAPKPVSWVPNRKVLTQFITNVFVWVVALLVAKAGLHENSAAAAIVTAVIGIVAGAVAGYLVKEIPRLEQDVAPKPAPSKM